MLVDYVVNASLYTLKLSKALVKFMEALCSSSLVEKIELFDGSDDAYGGVVVEMKEPMDSELFASVLRASLLQWTQQGKKGVWIKLSIKLAYLIEPTVEQGFRYHHAEPSYLMLVKWIPRTSDTLPPNASHRVGIGAFVMNDAGEVLVVQEKSGIFKGTGVWKFPTGVVEEGEELHEAAIREVKEEAGIEAEFLEVLAFSQSLNSFFGKSDLFFVCMLRPLSLNIQKQDSEIEAARWIPLEEYTAQPFIQKHEQFKLIANVCLEKTRNKYTGFTAVPTTSAFSTERNQLYLHKKDLNSLN
ncbi:nudix hydrolase 2-like isoform X1 [Diospyros lotus]|uniref:nudix hydrolase 2-like isoform X1 n=2 Tax=Diospyros lotus TaxID=55363 RepID=UPI002259D68E|nr:nudix hydrolase 2-like isoform X1 [Diospyros lotus]